MENSTIAEDFPDSPNGVVHTFTVATAEETNGTSAYATGTSSSDQSSPLKGDAKKKRRCPVKIIHVLCVVIVVVWGLLLLPIVFYHLPQEKASLNTTVTMNTSNKSQVECFPYPTTSSGSGICQNHLTNILLSINCEAGEAPLVLQDMESTASQLLFSLSIINPSPACSEAVVPFLCVFLFGLCDSSGVPIQPTSTQCEHIRDTVCPDEWRSASLVVDLPDCESFPTEQASCPTSSGSGSNHDDMLTPSVPVEPSNMSAKEALSCSDGFYREDPSGVCLPSCHSWLQYPKEVSIFIDVVVFLTAFIGFIVALAVLVISFLRRKRMFVFPSVFVVYKTIDLLVLALFVMVNYMDRSSLFCSSESLFESRLKVTPFCVISGMAFVYILLQLSMWWLCHTTALFWKIRFPFHARSFEVARRIKYIHIACVIAGLVVPLVPIITSMVDSAVDLQSINDTSKFVSGGLGFGQTRFPAILCTGTDRDATFYSVVLPIDIILMFGCTLLIVIFWIVHKQHGLFRANQSKSAFKIGTAERKLLVVFCYYVVLAVVSLTAFTLSTRNLPKVASLIIDYFTCEGKGHNPEAPCSRSEFESLQNPVLTTLSYVLLGLFPLVNLIYALNVQELKERCGWCKMKGKISISDVPSTASSAVNSSTLRRQNDKSSSLHAVV